MIKCSSISIAESWVIHFFLLFWWVLQFFPQGVYTRSISKQTETEKIFNLVHFLTSAITLARNPSPYLLFPPNTYDRSFWAIIQHKLICSPTLIISIFKWLLEFSISASYSLNSKLIGCIFNISQINYFYI